MLEDNGTDTEKSLSSLSNLQISENNIDEPIDEDGFLIVKSRKKK